MIYIENTMVRTAKSEIYLGNAGSLRVHEAARQSIQIAAVPQGRQEDREAFDPVAQRWQQVACRNLV